MKLRKKKCPETRMKSSFFLKCVWLIQLLPRRCAPQPFRAGSPRWFLYVFMYGVIRQDAPPTPMPQHGGALPHKAEKRLLGRFFVASQTFLFGVRWVNKAFHDFI